MKKILAAAALFLLPASLFAQYPGGVGTNLRLWLKANSGISLSPANTVTQWNELSGAGITGNFATQPAANIGMAATQNPPAYGAAGINFNPHVIFSQAAVNSISSNNAFVGTQLIDPYNNTMLQVIQLHTMGGTGVWFKWQYINTNANRMGNEVNNGGGNAGKLRFDFRGVNNFSATVINDKYFLAGCLTTQAQNTIRLNGANDNAVNYGTQAAFSAPATNPARITLGNEEYGDAYPTTVDIAEVILYNRALTAAERNKVESYLAVKYGFTLDQSATSANNYTSSAGTVIWNRAANLPFVNNITGIGRDDGDSLVQRQSRSINTTGLVTVYNGSYNGSNAPALNTANPNNFSADQSYLLFGDNGGTTALNRCFSGNPAYLRMNRSWKVQVTGTIGTVTLAVKATDVPANTSHLLIATDSAFTPGNTTAYKLDAFNGILSKQVVLHDNEYFTFASDSLVLKVSATSPLCVGGTLQLNAIVTGAGSFSWTGPGSFSSTVQNPSIFPVNETHSGTYTVTASTNGCSYKPASVTVVVNPIPAPVGIVTPLIYCQGEAAAPLTGTGQNLAWYSTPFGGGATTVPPVPNTLLQDTLTWWVTQTVHGCESIRSRQDVFVYTKPNGVINAARDTICQGDTDTFSYYGNMGPDAQYDWKAPLGRTTVISGSGPGPVVVRFDSAGTYNIRLQVGNHGCIGNEILFPVIVRPRPFANVVMQRDGCEGEEVNVALNYITPAIANYEWNFNSGVVGYGSYPGGPFGVTWAVPGTKIVSLTTTTAGCKSITTTDTITIHPRPVADIISAVPGQLCSGDSVLLEAQQSGTLQMYTWSPKMFFPVNGQAAAWGIIGRSGYVSVEVTSQWGCQATDSVLLAAKPCCEVFLPGAFSPNGDGRNDYFHILTRGHHEIADFRVVNRWGQTVFETRDESRGWDGTYNGVLQDIGTYYYYLRFRCSEEGGHNVEQKGEVILVR